MMNLLLKQEGYPPAVLVALILHGVLLWFILDRQVSPNDMIKIEPPSISASSVKENPQKVRKLEQVQNAARQRASDEAKAKEARAKEQAIRDREAAQKAEAERKKKADAQRVADQAKKDAAIKEQEQQAAARRKADADAAAEKQRQAEVQRKAQEQAEAERKALANTQSQSANDDLVSQYVAIITDLITQNWDQPPSARNGMAALVELRTTPVGDITSYIIIQSSGDAAFDRSVLQAVARVDNFLELRDLPIDIYERNFRRFNLLFKPEDLLR